jgi:hypothetical protein
MEQRGKALKNLRFLLKKRAWLGFSVQPGGFA